MIFECLDGHLINNEEKIIIYGNTSKLYKSSNISENISALNEYKKETAQVKVKKYNTYFPDCLFALRKDNLFNITYVSHI